MTNQQCHMIVETMIHYYIYILKRKNFLFLTYTIIQSISSSEMCAHTWSSRQPTLRRPGSSWGFGALLKGLTSVVDNSCRSRDSNPQPRVTSPTLYPLGHGCPAYNILYA